MSALRCLSLLAASHTELADAYPAITRVLYINLSKSEKRKWEMEERFRKVDMVINEPSGLAVPSRNLDIAIGVDGTLTDNPYAPGSEGAEAMKQESKQEAKKADEVQNEKAEGQKQSNQEESTKSGKKKQKNENGETESCTDSNPSFCQAGERPSGHRAASHVAQDPHAFLQTQIQDALRNPHIMKKMEILNLMMPARNESFLSSEEPNVAITFKRMEAETGESEWCQKRLERRVSAGQVVPKLQAMTEHRRKNTFGAFCSHLKAWETVRDTEPHNADGVDKPFTLVLEDDYEFNEKDFLKLQDMTKLMGERYDMIRFHTFDEEEKDKIGDTVEIDDQAGGKQTMSIYEPGRPDEICFGDNGVDCPYTNAVSTSLSKEGAVKLLNMQESEPLQHVDATMHNYASAHDFHVAITKPNVGGEGGHGTTIHINSFVKKNETAKQTQQ